MLMGPDCAFALSAGVLEAAYVQLAVTDLAPKLVAGMVAEAAGTQTAPVLLLRVSLARVCWAVAPTSHAADLLVVAVEALSHAVCVQLAVAVVVAAVHHYEACQLLWKQQHNLTPMHLGLSMPVLNLQQVG